MRLRSFGLFVLVLLSTGSVAIAQTAKDQCKTSKDEKATPVLNTMASGDLVGAQTLMFHSIVCRADDKTPGTRIKIFGPSKVNAWVVRYDSGAGPADTIQVQTTENQKPVVLLALFRDPQEPAPQTTSGSTMCRVNIDDLSIYYKIKGQTCPATQYSPELIARMRKMLSGSDKAVAAANNTGSLLPQADLIREIWAFAENPLSPKDTSK
jgi:hypothetical protein